MTLRKVLHPDPGTPRTRQISPGWASKRVKANSRIIGILRAHLDHAIETLQDRFGPHLLPRSKYQYTPHVNRIDTHTASQLVHRVHNGGHDWRDEGTHDDAYVSEQAG